MMGDKAGMRARASAQVQTLTSPMIVLVFGKRLDGDVPDGRTMLGIGE